MALKRYTQLKRKTPLRSKSPLRVKGISDTSQTKDDIQDFARAIVIIRDGGCIARDEPWHTCSGYRKDGQLILQADHLLSRRHSLTYADTRLIVCVCKGLHGWKKYNEAEYNRRIRPLLPPDRAELWDRCEAAVNAPTRKYTYDWRMERAYLKSELRKLDSAHPLLLDA